MEHYEIVPARGVEGMEPGQAGQRLRDGFAFLVVAADWATYAVLLHQGTVGFIKDPRAMASIVLISSVVLCPMSARYWQLSSAWTSLVGLLGAAALGLGIATLVTDGWAVLAALVIMMAVIWVLAFIHHQVKAEPAARRAPVALGEASGAHGPADVLVVYASRHGFTQGIAERLAATLRASRRSAHVCTAGAARDLNGYGAFVVGSAAYTGRWLRPATDFVLANREVLASHPLWLFSSGPLGTSTTDPKGRDILKPSEPKEFAELRKLVTPVDLRVFFGGLDTERLGRAERVFRSTPVGRQLLPEGDFRDWPAKIGRAHV